MSPRTCVVAVFMAALTVATPGAANVAASPAHAQSCTVNGLPCAVPATAADYAAGYASMNSQGLFGRAISTTTDTGGQWAVTWSHPLVVPPANVQATARAAGVSCAVTSATTLGAAGYCTGFRALPGNVTVLTQLNNYSITVAATGVQVDIAAQASNDPPGA